MRLAPSTAPAVPGDFGAIVAEGEMRVPQAVFDAATALALVTSQDLLAYAQTFPTALAGKLQWQPSDAVNAATALADLMRAHGENPQPPTDRPAYGAMNPRED
jgi:hypothetical protein